jgi:hypothetical protein
MKQITLIFFLGLFIVSGISLKAQINRLPSVEIYTLDGIRVNSNTISNNGLPMIIVFFKTFDKNGLKSLVEINEAHDLFLNEFNVKVVAICIDCIGKTEHIKPLITGNDLSIEVFVDKNGDLKRAMGIPNSPYTLLFDHQMNLYCKYNGYCSGIEELVCGKIKECLSKMPKTK